MNYIGSLSLSTPSLPFPDTPCKNYYKPQRDKINLNSEEIQALSIIVIVTLAPADMTQYLIYQQPCH